MTQNTFDLKRLYHFFLRKIRLDLQPMIIGMAGISGILLLISILVTSFNKEDILNLIPLYLTGLFLSGFIFTSRFFLELSKPQKSYSYLTLPVSNLEKLLASWLICSPVFVAVYLTLISIIYWISLFQGGATHLFIELYRSEIFPVAGIYIVTQTIFFLGACTFRNNHFFKTLISLFLFAMILAAFTGTLIAWLFGEGANVGGAIQSFSSGGRISIQTIPTLLFWFVLPAFMMLVSYFKLKERQA